MRKDFSCVLCHVLTLAPVVPGESRKPERRSGVPAALWI